MGLSGVDITARNDSGGLAGFNNGTISNSYTTGTVSSTVNRCGGLVGQNDGSISNSYSTSTVTTANSIAGGLVGDNDGSGSISNSYAAGTVNNGESTAGGLVGRNDGSISSSYSIGMAVTSSVAAIAGGLVGQNSGSFSNSYATGTASSTASSPIFIGGLVGNNLGSFNGINYFAGSEEKDLAGNTPVTLDGVGGGGSCDAAVVCVQATGGDDAARAAWLADSLDETLDSGLNWDDQLDDEGDPIWGNLNAAGFPCLKNMPAGAPSCL